jgi:WD40 repeat protein
MPEPSRVFISYARKDGASLAQRLLSDLTKAGFDAWVDTQRISGGAIWSTEVEREIDACQVMLALLSPGAYTSEICRAEQLRALDRGKRVIPVLAVSGSDRPLYLYARQYRDLTNDSTYSLRFDELLTDIRGDATATLPDNYRKTRVTYLTTPPRVANYLERTEALHALRNSLLKEDDRQPVALTALAGMGGIGKTVLAKALTDDNVVQRAFPDGIVWITAGKERTRDFVAEMREVAKALGDDLSKYDTALACENAYRTTIANKAALIVVDDVWSKADIEPLLAESPRSRFLFTTRDASIGRFVGAREHRADLLDFPQARALLASWADLSVAQLPAEADEIIHECGRLPLALSVVGAMVRGTERDFWVDTLDLLRRADLSAIHGQLPKGQESFFKAVEVSFQSLEPELRKRYTALAVLLEDMAAPLPLLQTLWSANAAEARRISRQLLDRSLAQQDGTDGSIRLHDLQLDYVRTQFKDRQSLELIHGAVRLSSHVIEKDPNQFASQIVGRLLPCQDTPAIARWIDKIAAAVPGPWLRPLKPALRAPGTGLLRTLKGHAEGVCAVAVTADGRHAVSASSDQTLKVWDLETGRPLHTLKGHSSHVQCVAMTADGRRAVSGSLDQTLKVWDLETGQELRTLAGHSASIDAVAVTPDGRLVVSASDDNTLKVWDPESGRPLRTLEGHSSLVKGVAVTADGRQAVSASWDGTLKVWDLETGRPLRTLKGHSNYVHCVAMMADGRRAVSASLDNTLKVWDPETGQALHTLELHSAPVDGVAITADGLRALSACRDDTATVWDLAAGRELRKLEGHSGPVAGVAVTADGRRAVSASRDNTLKVWDLESAPEPRTMKGHAAQVFTLAVTADGRRAVSASADNTLKVWDLESSRELCTLGGHFAYLTDMAVTADGRRAVSASGDHTLKVWDLESARELHTLEGHSASVNRVSLTPNGRRALSVSGDNTLKVWDPELGWELRTLAGHESDVFAVAVTADGRRAVSTSADRTLKVWDVESGRELYTLEGHSSPVVNVLVTADGRRAVSTCSDHRLKVWDMESGREVCTLEGHSSFVIAAAVTADGRRAVSASRDQTLKVWDLEDGRELHTLAGHSGPVTGVAVTADQRHAVSASEDTTLRVWDLESGEVVATFTCDGQVCCVSLGGPIIAAGDILGRVHVLKLQPRT